MSLPPLQFWVGQTVHKRYLPFERRFAYQLFLVDVDIDRLREADRATPLFRIDRPGLFSLRCDAHGPRQTGACLRRWADDMFARASVWLHGGMIRLVTFPRHLGFKFAPLSLWYGYGPDGTLKGLIYEVNNTFGEHHFYVASADAPAARREASKTFHVSPFFDVSGQYRFKLTAPGERLDVTVENLSDGRRTHFANIIAKRQDATSSNLLAAALRYPFSSFGVVAGIHWEALQLWLRGVRYHHRPPLPAERVTLAVDPPPTVSTFGEIS